MRQKRVKGYRKVMQLYCASFGFREPYQLLVDAEFVKACVQQKLDFNARLQDVLQGVVKPMITQCCIQALYDLGPEGQPFVEFAKEFERRKCNHFKPRPQDECLESVAGTSNPHRYVFATQSIDLRQQLRKVPGTPIVYIARSVVLLETPSDQTMQKKQSMENAKLHASKEELALLSGKPLPPPKEEGDGKEEEEEGKEEGEQEGAPKKKKKQRGPKGPNPLSVPKKKKAPAARVMSEVQATKKRTRDELERDGQERKRRREDNERVIVTSSAARGTERGRAAAGTNRQGGGTTRDEEGGGGGGGGENGSMTAEGAKKKRKRRKKNAQGSLESVGADRGPGSVGEE
ncbi:hypothetical protein JCM3766R1_006491 [Sporobolomyces carnicolor]